MYVAMTRAKEHLHVLMPLRFYVKQQTALGDRHVYASRTRFITEKMLPLYEPCSWPATNFENARIKLKELKAMNVRDRANLRWK